MEFEDLELTFQTQLWMLLKNWMPLKYLEFCPIRKYREAGIESVVWMFFTREAWERIEAEDGRLIRGAERAEIENLILRLRQQKRRADFKALMES